MPGTFRCSLKASQKKHGDKNKKNTHFMQPLYSLSITIIENSLHGPCLNVLHFFNQGKINLIRICNLSVYTDTQESDAVITCAFTHKGPNHNKQESDQGFKILPNIFFQRNFFHQFLQVA